MAATKAKNASTGGTGGVKQAEKQEQAQSPYNLGVMAGVGFLNHDFGSQIVLGLQGNYKFHPNLSAGLYATYNSIAQVAGISSSLWTFTPQATWTFNDLPLPGLLGIGAKAGLGFTHVGSGTITIPGLPATTSQGSTDTTFVFGPHVVYDFPLQPSLSVGAEANYMIYTGHGGYNALNLLGALKYWF